MRTLKVRITGKAPLIMHKDTLANPLHPSTIAHKLMTDQKKKPHELHLAIAKSEFIAGCYWNKDSGFLIPGQNLDSCLIAAAKLQKLGVKFKQGVQVVEDELLLDGFSNKTPDEIWENLDHVDVRGVKVGQAIYQAVNAIAKAFDDNKAAVALPEKFKVHDLEPYLYNRRRARGTMTTESVPTHIYFKCEPFAGLQERTFVLRLGIQTGTDKLGVVLRIVKQEAHDEEMANEFARKVDDALLGWSVPVLVGSYAKA